MNGQNYTEKSLEALRTGQRIAKDHGNQTLEPEHIMLSLVNQEDGLIPEILKKCGFDIKDIRAECEGAVSRLPKVSGAKGDNLYMSGALDSALAVGRGQLGGPRGLGRAPWLPPRWRAARLFRCPPASAASHPLQASWLSQVQRTGLAGDCAHRWRKEVVTPAQTLSPSVSPSALLYGLILPVVSAAQGSPGHPA